MVLLPRPSRHRLSRAHSLRQKATAVWHAVKPFLIRLWCYLRTPRAAHWLGQVREPDVGTPVESLHGPREARGADVAGTQIHSVRLPSFIVSTEVIFALSDLPASTTALAPG